MTEVVDPLQENKQEEMKTRKDRKLEICVLYVIYKAYCDWDMDTNTEPEIMKA